MNASASRRIFRSLALLWLMAGLLGLPSPAAAANLLVNSANDLDDGHCDARHCSLREAINAANADPGWDRIDFDIPGSGPHTITLLQPLPSVTDNQTWILAASEPDFAGQPVVILNGYLLACGDPGDAGWVIESDDNIVRGFSFIRFPACRAALKVTGSRNEIEGNYVGVAVGRLAAGTCAPYVSGYSNVLGISIASGDGNSVRDNVISCNYTGVGLGLYPTGTIVQGNYIGTDPAGDYAIPNGDGVIVGGGSGTLIGGDEPSDRNIISGNDRGVVIFGNDTQVSGNRIGTNAAGDAAIPNQVGLDVRGSNTVIGGDTPAQINVISGNVKGIWIQGEYVTVVSNRIGTDSAGVAAVPNGVGIMIEGPGPVAIGSPSPELGNMIAYNDMNGVFVGRVQDLQILGNVIHSNGEDGIFIFKGQDILIQANTFYSNGEAGVRLGETGVSIFDETVQRTTITINSFHRNGGLAIRFGTALVNGEIRPPTITAVSRTSASGTTCPGCVVEIFLAEPDPTGFGEGRDFLVSVTAGADGAFTATFPEVGNCKRLTTTATDADGNTSMFSENQTVGVCVAPAPTGVSLIILIVTTLGGSAFMPDLHLRPLRLRGSLRRLLGGLLGLAVGGAALGIIALIQGNAQARLTEEPIPPCGDFLNENLTSPPSGAVFELGTDVVIELSPQPDPPGSQSQWRFEVTKLQAGARELTRETPSLHLSELGFDPRVPGEYFWQVIGERRQQGAEAWVVFCQDPGTRLFSILRPTPTETAQPPTPTSTATPTPTVTPTPTLAPPVAVALQNAFCRFGPGQIYEAAAILNQGQSAPIQGRSNDDNWWFVLPPGERYGCWVWTGAVEATGDINGVPRRQAPPTPTPTACWVQACGQCPLVCTVPCPANPTPGGACTP